MQVPELSATDEPPGRGPPISSRRDGAQTLGDRLGEVRVTSTTPVKSSVPREGLDMRVRILRNLVGFLVLFTLATGACAHGTYLTQHPAPEQGSGGAGGY